VDGAAHRGPRRRQGLKTTNNLIVDARHIRAAIGRDYADVPPTRGVYKGATAVRSELAVAVSVGPVTSPLAGDVLPFTRGCRATPARRSRIPKQRPPNRTSSSNSTDFPSRIAPTNPSTSH
jgi:hypothetical protein